MSFNVHRNYLKYLHKFTADRIDAAFCTVNDPRCISMDPPVVSAWLLLWTNWHAASTAYRYRGWKKFCLLSRLAGMGTIQN